MAGWGAWATVGGLGGLSLLGYTLGLRQVPTWGERALVAYVGLFAALFVVYLATTGLVFRRPVADRGLLAVPLAGALVVTGGYLPYLARAGPGVLGFLPEYFGSAEDFNIGLRYFLTGWIPLGSDLAREAVRGVTMLVLYGALGAALLRVARQARDDGGALAAAGTALSAYLLLVPIPMHAWYAAAILPFVTLEWSAGWVWFTGAVALSYLEYASPSGEFPFWARALEYLPLYGLLAWGWWRRAGARWPRPWPAEWRPEAAAPRS